MSKYLDMILPRLSSGPLSQSSPRTMARPFSQPTTRGRLTLAGRSSWQLASVTFSLTPRALRRLGHAAFFGAPGVMVSACHYPSGISSLICCFHFIGYEHRDQPFGILGSLLDVVGSVLEVATLNSDLTALVNGSFTDANVKTLNERRPGWQQQLKGYGVKLENRTITSIERLQDGAIVQDVSERKEYDEFRVHFADGGSLNRSAFITNFPSVQRSYIGKPLGVKYYGEKVNVNPGSMRTDAPGVFCCGDSNSDNSTNVPHAMFSGKKAAVYVHGKLKST